MYYWGLNIHFFKFCHCNFFTIKLLNRLNYKFCNGVQECLHDLLKNTSLIYLSHIFVFALLLPAKWSGHECRIILLLIRPIRFCKQRVITPCKFLQQLVILILDILRCSYFSLDYDIVGELCLKKIQLYLLVRSWFYIPFRFCCKIWERRLRTWR